MKTYRLRGLFASILMDSPGLYMAPNRCDYYKYIHVIDYPTYRDLGTRHKLTHLPKSCNNELVQTVLEQAQYDKTTPEQIERLKQYLKLAEQKDQNEEINSDIKKALKKILFGLMLIGVGGVGGFALMVLLIGLLPAVVSWISFLIIPIASYGIVKTILGFLQLGIGVFSFCFRQKNVEQLSTVENELYCSIPSRAPPPSYSEVMKNNTIFPTTPVLYSEPPTYQQALENSSTLRPNSEMPPLYIPALVPSSGHSAHFFPHTVNNPVGNTHSLLDCCRHYIR